jgi:hypothetical protein
MKSEAEILSCMSGKTKLVPFRDYYSFLNALNYSLTEHLHRAYISCDLDTLFQNTHTQ